MKANMYRTFSRGIWDMNDSLIKAEYLAEKFRPKQLLRKMVENKDYDSFKSLNRQAAKGNVRLHLTFLQESPDKIQICAFDRTNPTLSDIKTTITNLFKSKKNKKQLPTMTQKELINSFVEEKKLGEPMTIEIDPTQPYYQKIKDLIREFANKRYFGE